MHMHPEDSELGYRSHLTTVLQTALPGGGTLALRLGTDAALLLEIGTGPALQPDTSYAIVREKWPEVECEVEQQAPGAWRISTPALVITLQLDPFLLRVEDRHGTVRFETVEDGLAIHGREIHLTRRLGETESVYGFGEHGETFNRNPGQYRIWNADEGMHHPFRQYYCTIPAGICLPGGATGPHAVFVDNPGELFFRVGQPDPGIFRIETRTGDMRLWLFFEDTPAELISEYTELTGRMERPPMWALGFQQCRWSYETADRVREVAAEYRKRRIPCDVIYLDIHYMDRYRVFTWSPDGFPEPEKLLGDLRDAGFRVVTIVDPGVAVAEDYHACKAGLAEDWFFLRRLDGELVVETVWPGRVHLPDFTHPSVRRIWGNWQHAHLVSPGVSGIWNDMNEPALFSDGPLCRDLPGDTVHHDNGQYRAHREIHNVYGMCMARASREGLQTSRPEERPFVLTRSGWAGIQRYSAVWTGDNRSTFNTMPLDIALNLNMGMSGVPHVGCDIGGFSDNATAELFARWMEWGVLQPFSRAHSAIGTLDHEPWVFGPATERVARRMIELRYELLPYIYTQFVEACETGLPLNRPLVLEHPNDAAVASIGDQFLLGSDLLMAPVLHPGQDARAVYLPAGEWYGYWNGKRQVGGAWTLAEAPLGRPALFVRAGAAIPGMPVRQSTSEKDPGERFLDVWPGRRISGRLVEDDGISLRYHDGDEARIIFSGTCDDKAAELVIGAPAGSYALPWNRWRLRYHAGTTRIEKLLVNGKETPFEQGRRWVEASFPASRKPIEIRLA